MAEVVPAVLVARLLLLLLLLLLLSLCVPPSGVGGVGVAFTRNLSFRMSRYRHDRP
jgi:hypothetical protein